jgi:hypothetical protein
MNNNGQRILDGCDRFQSKGNFFEWKIFSFFPNGLALHQKLLRQRIKIHVSRFSETAVKTSMAQRTMTMMAAV